MATARSIRTAPKANHPRRGEIYLTALDPPLVKAKLGREIQKTRPALVIQNDVSNRLSGITIVAPIASTVRFPLNPVHVLLVADHTTGLSVTSVALFKRLGSVDVETLERVDEAIKISLGLIPL
jgi:mRNA interferase MazF